MTDDLLSRKKALVQRKLLIFAAIFLFLYSIVLTLSPAVRAHTWNVEYRWSHWLGLLIWLLLISFSQWQIQKKLPNFDPFIFPIAALLSGWGLLTIFRLNPYLGFRQSVWLTIAIFIFLIGIRSSGLLTFLRKYKYLWLFAGMLAIALTLFLGSNPLGYGPRMWLGCCGIYIQPSEPLKLLLVIFLAAYLADREQFSIFPAHWQSHNQNTQPLPPDLIQRLSTPTKLPLLPTIAPTLLIIAIAGSLLLLQHDLGTAFIIFFLFATMVFIATGRKRVLLFSLLLILLAMVAGYLLFDVVQIRIDAWINPWLDPSGSTYQIVQSLIAIANGNILGRGPGIGNPSLIPLSYSDFIFSSITEETGFIGAIAIFTMLAILSGRGILVTLKSTNTYKRYLAAGLTVLLIGQSLLIIGGNIRVFPLTGITLPFVSYGGSSLLTCFFALSLLIKISTDHRKQHLIVHHHQLYLHLLGAIFTAVALLSISTSWWSVIRSDALLSRSDNPRRAIADRSVLRGTIFDRGNSPINLTVGEPGEYYRSYKYPNLSNIVGYNNPLYGQSGIENKMDPYLRGIAGNYGLTIFWNQLLYGQPPPGRNIRLSISLETEKEVDSKMQGKQGAVILLNAKTGEILALSSFPTFDANNLEYEFEKLISDANAPLLNRVTQGAYPVGTSVIPLLYTNSMNTDKREFSSKIESTAKQSLAQQNCSTAVNTSKIKDPLSNYLSSGCRQGIEQAIETLTNKEITSLFKSLGFYTSPQIRLPTSEPSPSPKESESPSEILHSLQISPLQMALSYAPLSTNGAIPAPQIVTSIYLPNNEWAILKPLGKNESVFSSSSTEETANLLAIEGKPFWHVLTLSETRDDNATDEFVTWYIIGTLPSMETNPIVLVVVLEENNPFLAQEIGQLIMEEVIFH